MNPSVSVPSRPLPTPGGYALLDAMRVSRDPESFFETCEARDGELFCVALPGAGPIYLTGHPEGAREIFQAPPDLFEPLQPNPVEPLLGPGSLILLSGPRHKRERKLVAPAFHGKRMRAYGEQMRDLARDAVAALVPGEVFDARELTRSLTLMVIIRAIFGVTDPARVETVLHAIEATTARYSAMLALLPGTRLGCLGLSPWDRFRRAAAHLDAVLLDEVRGRKQQAEPGEDILSMLLSLRYEDGQPIEESDLLDELRTMLVAGHETAATGLAWALGYVHHDARVHGKLLEALATDDPLPAIPYLDAVCSESLRRHPVVPIVLRKLRGPMTLRGAAIPAGASVGVALTRLHTRPEVWARPLAFYPEHFLERTYTPFEYAPYGGGARRCAGAAFAGFEMRILLGTLLRTGRFEAVDALPRPITTSITMSPGGPIRLRFLGKTGTPADDGTAQG